MKVIDQLNLSHNQCKTIRKLPISLTHLNISENKIEKLPNTLAQLNRLKILNVSKNKLRRIIPVYKMNTLVELDISGNKIEELLFDIGQLYSLKKLDISNNNIIILPNSIVFTIIFTNPEQILSNLTHFSCHSTPFHDSIDEEIRNEYSQTNNVKKFFQSIFQNSDDLIHIKRFF